MLAHGYRIIRILKILDEYGKISRAKLTGICLRKLRVLQKGIECSTYTELLQVTTECRFQSLGDGSTGKGLL